MSAPVRYIRDMGGPVPMTTLAHQLRACLPDLADRTQSQLYELRNDPTLERCDVVYRALAEVATVIRRLGVELERGEQPTV